MSDDEHRVRKLAYRLWEEAGRPQGRDQEFWHMASARIAAEALDRKPTAGPEPEVKAPPPPPAEPKKAKAAASAVKPAKRAKKARSRPPKK